MIATAAESAGEMEVFAQHIILKEEETKPDDSGNETVEKYGDVGNDSDVSCLRDPTMCVESENPGSDAEDVIANLIEVHSRFEVADLDELLEFEPGAVEMYPTRRNCIGMELDSWTPCLEFDEKKPSTQKYLNIVNGLQSVPNSEYAKEVGASSSTVETGTSVESIPKQAMITERHSTEVDSTPTNDVRATMVGNDDPTITNLEDLPECKYYTLHRSQQQHKQPSISVEGKNGNFLCRLSKKLFKKRDASNTTNDVNGDHRRDQNPHLQNTITSIPISEVQNVGVTSLEEDLEWIPISPHTTPTVVPKPQNLKSKLTKMFIPHHASTNAIANYESSHEIDSFNALELEPPLPLDFETDCMPLDSDSYSEGIQQPTTLQLEANRKLSSKIRNGFLKFELGLRKKGILKYENTEKLERDIEAWNHHYPPAQVEGNLNAKSVSPVWRLFKKMVVGVGRYYFMGGGVKAKPDVAEGV
jgi:hypothetical protein